MALQRTSIAVPLAGGIDTKTDAKVVLPTKLVALENGDFTKGGSVRMRQGYTARPALAETIASGYRTLDDAHAVAALGDGFVMLGRRWAYAWRDDAYWQELGPYTHMTHVETEVAASSVEQTRCDMASNGGYTVVCWEDSRGGVRYSLIDDATGVAVESERVIASANAEKPRAVAVGNALFVLYFNPSSDAIHAVGVLNGATVTLVADAHTDGLYDVCSGGDYGYVVFRQDPGVADQARVFKFNSVGVVVDTADASTGALTGPAPAIGYDAENGVVMTAAQRSGTTTIQVYRFRASDMAIDLSTTWDYTGYITAVDQLAIGPAKYLGFEPDSHTGVSGRMILWYGYDGAAASTAEVQAVPISSGGLPEDDAISYIKHARLVSGSFFDGVNNYALVRYDGSDRANLQNAYYVYRDDGVVVARMLYGEAATGAPNDHHPGVQSLGDGKFQVALGFQRQVPVNLNEVTGATTKLAPVFEHQGIRRCVLDTDAPIYTVEVDGVLYTSGGFLWAVDGCGSPVEAQFQMFPDCETADGTPGFGGGLTVSSTYWYRWYYEWTNGRGQRVRSMALEIEVETGGADGSVDFELPTLRHTNRHDLGADNDARSPVAIVGYRTKANENTFYYRITDADPTVTGDNGYVANTPGTDTVTFTDVLSDTDLASREVDYRSTGEAPHFAFDGPSVIAAVGNRVFAVGGGRSPNNPQYSFLRRDGFPLETTDTNVVTEFPEFGGSVTGLADLNGQPVVFRERAIYGLTGQGPFNTGVDSNSPYQAQAVSSEVGCVDPRSIVSTRDGVFFKSAKGIYLLDRSFQVAYIGADVEAFNDLEIVGAAIVPDTNMVLFFTGTSRALMYDYFYRSWGTYTNHEAMNVATTGADIAYLRPDGQVYIRGGYTDAGASYDLYFKTAPLHLADTVQGLYRLRKFQVLGEYITDHTLDVSLYYNRERVPYQVVTFDPGDILEFSVWGDDSVWGSDTVWGGPLDGQDYNFEDKVMRQKASTVSFEFRVRPGTTPGAGCELTELALEVAVRTGLARLAAARKL